MNFRMVRVLRWLSLSALFLVVCVCIAWGTLALWFKLPGPDVVRGLVAACFALLGLGTLVAFFSSTRWRWLLIFAITLSVLIGWWNTLVPPSEGNWSPEVARQVTGSIDGDTLTLTNMRDFRWRTSEDFDEAWVTRSYDLSQIETVDLFMSYWAGPEMAHLMISFGFANGDYLAWSNEVRRQVGGSFSPVADFFKANPIAIIASEERDAVGLRSNIQKARVQMFRLHSTPEARRDMIEVYVAAANELSKTPHWFNSLFTNCSRSVIMLARHVGIDIPADYRVLVNGYFPDYLYEHGAINTDVSLEDHYRLGNVSERALTVGLTDAYSNEIRMGVPAP